MNIFRHLLFGVLVFFTACNSDRTPVKIKGNAPGLDGVVRLSEGDSVLIAENISIDGTFIIDGIINSPGFFLLELFENGKSDKNAFLVYLDKDPVQVNFHVPDLKIYPNISSKSKHQADIGKYYSRLIPLLQAADSDYRVAKKTMELQIDRTPDGDEVIKLIEEFSNAENRKNTIESDIKENYIVNNPGSLLSAYLLSQSQTDISKKPALYNDLYENLTGEIKKSKYGIQARSLIQSALKRNTKFLLPEIEGKMPDGSSFNAEMIKGKITLVMFWASWNKVSTNDLAALKPVYQKLKPRGFEILAIALDKSPEKWKKYIKDNQLNWLHISDFKGAASENITSFNNNKIPYYFLVGPDLQVTDQDFPVSSVEVYFNDLKSKSRAK